MPEYPKLPGTPRTRLAFWREMLAGEPPEALTPAIDAEIERLKWLIRPDNLPKTLIP